MRPVALKKDLNLTLRMGSEVPRVIVGDPTRLRQVVFNLVGNAIKFTQSGWVMIAIDRTPADSGQTRIAIVVEDTGIGIAPDRIRLLFQEFSQSDSSVTRKYGGTGLGLAISDRLVQKMGGAIRVESTLGRGSKFIVEIPVRLGEARDVRDSYDTTLSQSEKFPGCCVLLAEDNMVNQRLGQRILERLGCRVDVAGNGREAIKAAESTEYDVILMDLHMPEVDGLEAARRICARWESVKRPRIIAMTANAMEGDRAECLAAGMDDYLTKPIRVDRLIEALSAVPTIEER
jgi:CheY-like chemotaxis protein/anti-sigma regulatory factor (Ser/Thr protein kinase)